jgi:hypothetical protein
MTERRDVKGELHGKQRDGDLYFDLDFKAELEPDPALYAIARAIYTLAAVIFGVGIALRRVLE